MTIESKPPLNPYHVELNNLHHWTEARQHIDEYPDALDTERTFLDRMIERTRERIAALGNIAVAPLTVLMGEQGQGEE